MKLYIKALVDYEENNNSFELLCNFMSLRKSDLLDLYCKGKINLPSFIILKKLKEKYKELTQYDKELDTLFEQTIVCSKIFYSRTLKIISTEGIKFENLFSQQAKPVGQKLINLLLNIKLKIRLIRLNRTSPKRSEIARILEKFTIFANTSKTISTTILYKLSLLLPLNHKYTSVIHLITIIFITSIFLVSNYYFISNLPATQITGLNLIFCMLITLIMLFYPFRRFDSTDINGKDALAYKYKVFFNNISNKKMYQMFALEHLNISRQKVSASIDYLEQ